jgi:hypothetical protein
VDYTFAYLDAGTGTLLLQLLAGGIAGVLAFVKFRWKSVRGWLRREEKSGQ